MQNLSKEELINKILEFKEKLDEKLKYEYEEKIKSISEDENPDSIKSAEITDIIYYNDFSFKTKIQDLAIKIQDIFIVEINDNGKITCEIYSKDISHKIAQIDVEGKITFCDEKLEENTTLSEIIENNLNKEIYEMKELNKEELEELELQRSKETEKDLKEVEQQEQSEEQNELLEDTEKNTEKLEEELHLERGDIRACADIKLTGKDNLFRNKVKESKEYDSVKLVYVASEDAFRFVGLKKGKKPKFLETIEPSQRTTKSGMNINAENGKVEEQNISRVMKFTDSKDYDFSVKIGQYGKIELDMLRKDPVTNKYISTKVETKSERPKEEQRTINEFMDKNKNTRINEELDEFEEIKQDEGKDAKVNLNDISDEAVEKKEEIDRQEDENERTLDENVRKYYY